ncbi:hypothetical protein BT63DRAFT_470862 [Microthyrium microscopicum]|uniref:Uncharacterized protein n=1 Tax=Microthyrium microscopicum TaxID=703497 RepID=A0A6A6UAR2_9PEZI|nr:hypothetical protein BT63DRAFT_470862 [Microthyrium microscopicum]
MDQYDLFPAEVSPPFSNCLTNLRSMALLQDEIDTLAQKHQMDIPKSQAGCTRPNINLICAALEYEILPLLEPYNRNIPWVADPLEAMPNYVENISDATAMNHMCATRDALDRSGYSQSIDGREDLKYEENRQICEQQARASAAAVEVQWIQIKQVMMHILDGKRREKHMNKDSYIL